MLTWPGWTKCLEITVNSCNLLRGSTCGTTMLPCEDALHVKGCCPQRVSENASACQELPSSIPVMMSHSPLGPVTCCLMRMLVASRPSSQIALSFQLKLSQMRMQPIALTNALTCTVLHGYPQDRALSLLFTTRFAWKNTNDRQTDSVITLWQWHLCLLRKGCNTQFLAT